jgi:hypothetical protein
MRSRPWREQSPNALRSLAMDTVGIARDMYEARMFFRSLTKVLRNYS